MGAERRRFRLIPFGAIQFGTAPRYLVKGLLPRTGMAVVWGPPKCGKSFLVFDMLMHVALGWQYRGRRTHRGAVVYCALEGQSGFEARAEAFRQRRLAEGGEAPAFFLMPTPLRLVTDAAALIETIREQVEDGPPAVVCLDTLNRSFTGSESDDEAMTAYVRAADAIRDAFDCLVVIVHHCGIEGQRPRGHSALTGAVEAQLAVKKQGGVITLTVDAMKDGPEGESIASRLESVECGHDDDGDPITSCVVEPMDGEAMPATRGPDRRMNDRQRLAVRALSEALVSHGQPAPTSWGLPGPVNTVALDQWRDELRARGVIEGADPNPTTTYKRIKEQLAARNIIGIRDDRTWLAT